MRNLFKSHQNLIFDPSLLILLARLITLNFKKWFQRLEKLLARIRRNEKFPRNFNRGNLTRRLRRSVSLLRHILSVHRFVAAKQPLVPFATNPPTHLPRDLYKIIVRESVYLPLVVPTTYHVFNDTHTHTPAAGPPPHLQHQQQQQQQQQSTVFLYNYQEKISLSYLTTHAMYPLLLPPLCRHWKENFLIVSVARCHLRSVCCRCTAIKQSSCCCREWEKERERKIVQTVQRVSQRARAARVFEPEHLNAHLIPCQKCFLESVVRYLKVTLLPSC